MPDRAFFRTVLVFLPWLGLGSTALLWAAPFEVNAVKGLREFPDPFEVRGVVATANLTQGVLALVDRGNCGSCPTPDCGAFTLPVRWKGAMPGKGKTVLVKGSVRVVEGKRYFVAESVTLEEK